MSKRRRSKRDRSSESTNANPDTAARRGEVVTVAWTLTILATLGAEVVGAIMRLVVAGVAELPVTFRAVPGLMLFTAAITGAICLLLTPLVYRFRQIPPPTSVTVLAVTVSLLPLVVALLRA